MKLVLLGTNGLIPTDQGQTACLLLPEVGVMLDAGSGLYRLEKFLPLPSLDIFLTHAHGDHVEGLTWLFGSIFVSALGEVTPEKMNNEVRRYVGQANEGMDAVRIHATAETLAELQPRFGYLKGFRTLEEEVPLACDGRLTWFPCTPGRPEVGFRLDWPGHSLAYVTDATASPDAPYVEKIRGVDLLVHDCNGPDSTAPCQERVNHSHTSAVAQVAARAGVGRLLLVHHNPIPALDIRGDLPAAREIFPCIEDGHDWMEVEF